jgi:hypothetical protein
MREHLCSVFLCFLLPAGTGLADAPAATRDKDPQPKMEGTDNDPLIQIELEGFNGDKRAEELLACLNQFPWASRTAVLPRYRGTIAKERWQPKCTAALAVGERKWADIGDLQSRLREAGFRASAIRLTEFGTLRIRTQFALEKPDKQTEQCIEGVYRKLTWLADAKFTAAGTKPEFNFAKKAEVRADFILSDSQVIDVSPLLNGLSDAGFPPKALRVARMFAGVPFGFRLPRDVPLVDAAGGKLTSGQLQERGQPLVLVFFSLAGKYTKDKVDKTYQAEPAHLAPLKEVAEQYADRADFVAICSSKGDSAMDVAALWQKAGMPFPVYRDPEQRFATALSAAPGPPPPHIFIFDAAGKLRYAGEFADGWVEPEKVKRIYLAEALERVLANKFGDTGAVFNNSPPCACSAPECKCPKCGCGGPCRCGCPTGAG